MAAARSIKALAPSECASVRASPTVEGAATEDDLPEACETRWARRGSEAFVLPESFLCVVEDGAAVGASGVPPAMAASNERSSREGRVPPPESSRCSACDRGEMDPGTPERVVDASKALSIGDEKSPVDELSRLRAEGCRKPAILLSQPSRQWWWQPSGNADATASPMQARVVRFWPGTGPARSSAVAIHVTLAYIRGEFPELRRTAPNL